MTSIKTTVPIANSITNGDMQFDIAELREKLITILKDPHSSVVYPNSSDYDRSIKYKIDRLSSWLGSTPTGKQIYTKDSNSFTFARHFSFSNTLDAHPQIQRKRIETTKQLKRQSNGEIPSYYYTSYHTEYSAGSSYYTVAHCKDIINDKPFMDQISLSVMMDTKTRKPQSVPDSIKQLCDANRSNSNLKMKYNELKELLSHNMAILNHLRHNDDKQLLYSYPIQMRYDDEDCNNHLNVSSYIKYAIEGLNNYDKHIRNNQKTIYCMTHMYWNEIRMKYFKHCYVNIWGITTKLINNTYTQLYVGTIDIDPNICKRNYVLDHGRSYKTNEWAHYHGFIAGVVDVKKLMSKM